MGYVKYSEDVKSYTCEEKDVVVSWCLRCTVNAGVVVPDSTYYFFVNIRLPFQPDIIQNLHHCNNIF